MQKITNIENLSDLYSFCEEHRPLLQPSFSTYSSGRKELWIKHHSDLRKKVTIKEGFRNERLEALGNRLLSNFDIGLMLLYTEGTSIKMHRDHSIFGNTAISINLGESIFLTAKSRYSKEIERHHLKDGEIIKFNTKLLHGIEPVTTERWAIIFWHFK